SQKMFRDGWFYPGDRGQVHADGMLVIESRVDEIINVGGTKVNPAEVEQVLLEDPDIVDAAAYGVTDAAGRVLLLAAIVCRQPVDEQRTLARCHAVLGQKSPRRLVRLARLPRNEAGKVLRRELAANTRIGPAAARDAEPAA
ncbi:MAG TPA: hypothetical protein VLK85_08580, partial [Ramlibacter sp.]|nr:hypothetical protein [Ramlibacter sp.]